MVGRGHPEFSSARQQDAQEFYMHLLDMIEKCLHKSGGSGAALTSCLQVGILLLLILLQDLKWLMVKKEGTPQ